MKKFLLLFFVLVCAQCSVFAKSFEFAIISDTHLVPSNHPSVFTKSEKNIIFAVESVNKNKDIDFVVFLGDCIDKSRMDSLTSFMNIVQHLNKPYYIVLGNHDSYSAGGVAKEDFIKFVHMYNKRQDAKETSFYFKGAPNAYGLILDGSSWVVPGKHGRYLPEMLKETEKFLRFKKNSLVMIFQHFPIIPPNENVSHYTLDVEPYAAMLARHDNVILIASGHFHYKNLIVDDNGVYHISAPALGARATSADSGSYQVVKVDYKKKLFKKPTDVKIDVKDVEI